MATAGWPPIEHVWTQAIIGLCFVLMVIILIDLCKKFYWNAIPPLKRKKELVLNSSSNSVIAPTSPVTSTSTSRPTRSRKKPISKFYIITSITSVAAFSCAVLIDFGDGVYYFHSGIDVFHTKDYWAIILTNVFFGISTISLYIFMFGRLYLTFIESDKQYRLRHVI